ncbi:MAG: glutamine--fructose-6-phosphate transaminase (isomerizing) [Alphaproteobacteria bacterium]|nr:glutamine--fructose-6-phosphate transaminase (isomerizing) [Alphaproteobacteria bacterium]
MCGIIGIVSNKNVVQAVVDGLKRLEYRGYDSAGVATSAGGYLVSRRMQGKLSALEALLVQEPLQGSIVIGHTRWATHGAPTINNAHPHSSELVSVVHNGIIENHQALRQELMAKGHHFNSDTDTEVIPYLITQYIKEGKSPIEAAQAALARLQGAFAVAILFRDDPELLIGARRGSPLAVGYGEGEMYVASDAYALAPYTKRLSYLEEGDMVVVRRDSVQFYDAAGNNVQRQVRMSSVSGDMVGKGNYRHFMQKEIHEQPTVVAETLSYYLHPTSGEIALPVLPFSLKDVDRVTIVACGTSYYAGLVAKYWLESVAKIPASVDVASEFRYRCPPLSPGGLTVFISQSGETADTLAALRYARENKQHVLVVVNAEESTMAHEADAVLRTLAGPEIGVASTKAFTTQMTVLACLSLAIGRERGSLSPAEVTEYQQALVGIPAKMSEILKREDEFVDISRALVDAYSVLYIGRGTSYPLACEGALKLKELSYIHAEGIAAGELKHGPIALIDPSVPVIVVAPHDALFEKTLSNIQEVVARGGDVIALVDERDVSAFEALPVCPVVLPQMHAFITPIVYAIPVQLLAYHTASFKGTDVDQPRNLAKSVTVE